MARPTPARRLAATALVTALALTAAGCGADGGSEGETSSSTAPTDAPESAESSEPAGSGEASGDLEELGAAEFYPAVMGALREAGTFAFSFRTGTDGSDAGAMDLQGVMRYGDGGIDMQASGTGQGADGLEMVVLDQVLYLSGIGMDLGDKPWLRIDMSDPDSLFGMLGRATDPALMFQAMQEPEEFELLGSEEVDGVETLHYRVVMDTAAYAEAMEIPAGMTGALPDDIEVEMWVDADNLPRRFRQQIEAPAPGGGPGVATTTEGTYSDYGTDVTIEAPPASEVSDDFPGM